MTTDYEYERRQGRIDAATEDLLYQTEERDKAEKELERHRDKGKPAKPVAVTNLKDLDEYDTAYEAWKNREDELAAQYKGFTNDARETAQVLVEALPDNVWVQTGVLDRRDMAVARCYRNFGHHDYPASNYILVAEWSEDLDQPTKTIPNKLKLREDIGRV